MARVAGVGRADPMSTKSSTLSVAPDRPAPNTENADPQAAKCRRLREEPRCRKSTTLTWESTESGFQ